MKRLSVLVVAAISGLALTATAALAKVAEPARAPATVQRRADDVLCAQPGRARSGPRDLTVGKAPALAARRAAPFASLWLPGR